MFGIKSLLTGLVIGGGGMYFAHQYHVLHSSDGVIVVPRAQTTDVSTVYADVRGWSAQKWAETPELSAALLKDGRTDLMTREATSGLMDNTAKALNFPQPGYGTTQPIGGAATPEIVFRPSSESVRIPTQQPQQNSQEESLLDRLSRQLKQQRETDALKERPLIRETTSQHSARELIQPVSIPTGITQMIPQASIPQTSIPQSIPLEPMVQSIPVEPAPEAELGRSTQFPEVFEELSRSIAGDYEPTFQAIEAQVEESLQPVQQQMQRYSDPISAAQSNGLPIDDRHVADRIPRPVLDGLRSIVSQPTTTDGEVLKSY